MALSFTKSISDPISVDVGNYITQGRIVSKTVQYSLFTSNKNAVWAANNTLRMEAYPFANMTFVLNRDNFRLQVGDCFKFSYSKYGISDMICRVLQIAEENVESEKIIVTAMEDIYRVCNVPDDVSVPETYVTTSGYTLSPFDHQCVIEAPYVLSSTVKILPFACRMKTQDLGFDIYISIDGGSSYNLMSRVSNLWPYGTLVAAYSDDTYTLDDEEGFTIDFVNDADTIDTTTWENVFSGIANKAFLGNEIISFQSFTPVTATQYKLEGIIRGRYGTQKEAHAVGETFYFFGASSETLSHSELILGASRKFKLVPYNVMKVGEISDATAITLNVVCETEKPYMPINLMANGSNFVARYTSDVVLTWSARLRGSGAGIGIPGTVLADATTEGSFEIEVWVSGSKVRTDTTVNLTWTYTQTMNEADNVSLADVVTFKLLNYIIDGAVTYESDQTEVVCKKNI